MLLIVSVLWSSSLCFCFLEGGPRRTLLPIQGNRIRKQGTGGHELVGKEGAPSRLVIYLETSGIDRTTSSSIPLLFYVQRGHSCGVLDAHSLRAGVDAYRSYDVALLLLVFACVCTRTSRLPRVLEIRPDTRRWFLCRWKGLRRWTRMARFAAPSSACRR